MYEYPSYLSISREGLKSKADALRNMLESCALCPHRCGVNRLRGEKGFCRLDAMPKISAAHPHYGEESCISGKKGSGTIFFTGCNMACVYCQNYEISQLHVGEKVSSKTLAECMLRLQYIGCHNINLVTPTPQVPSIMEALITAVDEGLRIPLVYNTGGYDLVDTLKILEDVVDIYMPDIKYSNNKTAEKYSLVKEYYINAKKAVKEMHRQVGDLVLDDEGIAVRGLLIRHLLLPEDLAGSAEVYRFIAEELSGNTVVNVMDQYRPCYKAYEFPELSRKITFNEYREALELAYKTGLRRILK